MTDGANGIPQVTDTSMHQIDARLQAAHLSEIAGRLDAGDVASAKAFANHGGWAAWDRLQAWLADQRATFLAALVGGTDR